MVPANEHPGTKARAGQRRGREQKIRSGETRHAVDGNVVEENVLGRTDQERLLNPDEALRIFASKQEVGQAVDTQGRRDAVGECAKWAAERRPWNDGRPVRPCLPSGICFLTRGRERRIVGVAGIDPRDKHRAVESQPDIQAEP